MRHRTPVDRLTLIELEAEAAELKMMAWDGRFGHKEEQRLAVVIAEIDKRCTEQLGRPFSFADADATWRSLVASIRFAYESNLDLDDALREHLGKLNFRLSFLTGWGTEEAWQAALNTAATDDWTFVCWPIHPALLRSSQS